MTVDPDHIEVRAGHDRGPIAGPTPARRPMLVVAAVHAVVFAPVILNALFRPALIHPSLWVWHAARIPETFHVPWRPVQVHFGWAASSRLLDAVLPTSDPRVAGAIVSMAAAGAFGASLWFIFSRFDDGRPLLPPVGAAAASLLVALLEAPAALQGWMEIAVPDHAFLPLYYPFVPTTLASMGLNVAMVWMAARVLDGRLSDRGRRLMPLVIVAAAVAKPNITPTLAVVALVVAVAVDRAERRGHRPERPRPVIVDTLRSVTIPAAAITVLQFVVITRLSSKRLQGGVTLHPFYELGELGGFGWQFWLVLALPVAALALVGRLLVKDLALALSAGCFSVGLAAAILFARAGSTPDKGSVGGDILQLAGTGAAMVLIFTLRRLVVLQRSGELPRVAVAVLALVLVPYVAAGLDTWRCHAGVDRCYPSSVAGTWPQPPIEDP